MFLNTFIGAKFKKFISQILIIFGFAAITFYVIKNKNKDIDESIENYEIIYEKEQFNQKLLESRKKQSAPKLTINVGKGDTLGNLLKKNKFQNSEIIKIIEESKKIFNPKNLVVGQKIVIKYKIVNDKREIISIEFPMDFNKNFYLENVDGVFSAKIVSEKSIKRTVKKSGFISDSLYLSGIRSGVDIKTISEAIRILSFSIDFQRDIWRNDEFEILFKEEYLKYDNLKKKSGEILFVSLDLQSGNSLKLYRFKNKKDVVEYFDEKGKSAKKLLMKTPIDGARLSSGFGMRKHPILGYKKKHRGIDFAAPKGTPVYAAGDGVIEEKGRKGAYGKYIRIRHPNNFKTAYAHLSKFRKIPGGRVKQGQIIGYVGSTGRSTGPHLHYEVLKNNIRINPQKLKLPSGRSLKGEELEEFLLEKNKIDRGLDNLNVF